MTPPDDRGAQQLIAYANEHLAYEVQMLRSVEPLLAPTPRSLPLDMWATDMALLESFTLHVRNLTAFLYAGGRVADDDVTADLYFERVDGWSSVRPRQTQALKRARERVNKEVAHLTWKRIAGTPSEKGWDTGVTLDLEKALAVSAREASPRLLGDSARRGILGLRATIPTRRSSSVSGAPEPHAQPFVGPGTISPMPPNFGSTVEDP